MKVIRNDSAALLPSLAEQMEEFFQAGGLGPGLLKAEWFFMIHFPKDFTIFRILLVYRILMFISPSRWFIGFYFPRSFDDHHVM